MTHSSRSGSRETGATLLAGETWLSGAAVVTIQIPATVQTVLDWRLG